MFKQYMKKCFYSIYSMLQTQFSIYAAKIICF